MKLSPVAFFAAALAAVLGVCASLPAAPSADSHLPRRSDLVERGRYLVNNASMCVDCHTPHDQHGALVEAKRLMGARIAFTPVAPMPWGAVAPRLAGLPAGFTHADTVQFLITGQPPQGRPAARPPMPEYRFHRSDAEAIATYLESLAPAK